MANISVHNAAELNNAIAQAQIGDRIEVHGLISGQPSVVLPEGVALVGADAGATLRFGAKGVFLSGDNAVANLRIETAETEVALGIVQEATDLGAISLKNLSTRGQVFLGTGAKVQTGSFEVDTVQVERADVRGRVLRPHAFGVDAQQGGFTVWNLAEDPSVWLEGTFRNISVGSKQTPVRGSGVFIGGHIKAEELTTAEVAIDGGITPSTPDLISGGVFVITGAKVGIVRNLGPVTTFGANDMVLDNWGEVQTWVAEAEAEVSSHGPSGIGFVQFGELDTLEVKAPIVTTGVGARGFNVYDGHLRSASFQSIATTGAGSIGIQISQPVESITVARDVTTAGGTGMSLVKGVQTELRAIGVSVKPGGSVQRLEIGGQVSTSGDGVWAFESFGPVSKLRVDGGVRTTGNDADALHTAADTVSEQDLAAISTHTLSGRDHVLVEE